MNRITQTATMFFTTLLTAQGAFALSANEIVAKADARRMPGAPIVFGASVQEFESDSMIRETKYKVYSKNMETGLVETVFPERQKGRKLLMEGDNLWMYTRDTSRPARVSMQQRLGGEIANGDLARTDFAGDYDATMVGDDSSDTDSDVYHLRLKAKRSGITYSRIDYWVKKESFLPVRAVYYAVSGKALKKATFLEPKKILGREVITKVKFQDSVEPKKSSMLIYTDHKKRTIPARVFNKEFLSE